MALRTLAAALVCLALLGCSGGGDDDPTPTAPAGATVTPGVAPTASGGTSAVPTQVVTPTAEGVLPGVADEPVHFQTEDGVVINGHLYSRPGPPQKVVIFTHMFPADQISWKQTAQEITSTGAAALTFDFRGYGESEGEKDIPNIHLDLQTAVYFLESRGYTEIYIVGASMGGTAALKVAATSDVEIDGVVTVSAPIEIDGLSAEEDVANYDGPKLFIASSGDSEAAEAVDYFMSVALDPAASHLFDGDAHGTDILQTGDGPALVEQITAFIASN
jgi:pimeloyl-ACP methyl ester carboxylesterase